MATANPDEVEIKEKFYENVKEYNFENCPYSLLIVGPCGAGKSAFCNFLLQEKRFKEAMGILAGTEKADYCTIPCKAGDMLVVDCPGFCDPKRSHEEIMKEISKAAILCRNGMDAIGIVIDPTSRFTETQKISYERIDRIGGEFWKHAFIIFNREKKLEKNFGSANEYIQQIIRDPKCPAEFRELLNKVSNHFICVESTKKWGNEDYWASIRDNMLAMVLQIKENNEGIAYTNSFTDHGHIAYKGLVELTQKMAQTMDFMQNRMDSQNYQLTVLQSEFTNKAAAYERTIKDLLEKTKTRCSVM